MGEPISSLSMYHSGMINARGAHSSIDIPTASSATTDQPAAAAAAAGGGGSSLAQSSSSSSSSSSCPTLSNESADVQQFLASHAVNGGIVDLLTAYLTELSLRCHLTW